ncbi:MAG: DinB family protein [Desulfobacterales bacterium]
MNHLQIITHLRVNGDVFKYLFKNLVDEQARWKPGADRWSLLEVINHLYDEEREDFRKRLALVLSDPDAPWPAIDPEGWVLQRGYNERKLNESLDNFFRERSTSLTWLRELASPDWQAIHHHPKMGSMSAELLLANWLAHDLFHIRQVNDLHFAYLTQLVAPVSLGYSGWE